MDVLRLTLRQLQIFVAVARCGTTTAASADIALSQSATSSAIKELERLLSAQLFDRVGKRLLLNDQGRALLPRALSMLDGAAGIEHLSRDAAAQSQSLRVGASSTIGNHVLPQLLGRFLAALAPEATPQGAPTWQSRMHIANTEAICDAVASFALDIGLIEGPCHQPSLRVQPWLQDELLVLASPQHPLAADVGRPGTGKRIPLHALRSAVWLLREPGSGTREATDQLLLPHLRSYVRSIEIGSSEAIKHTAAQGLGLACLSWRVASDLMASGQLCRLPTTLPRLHRQWHVVTHQDKHHTPALRSFMQQVFGVPEAGPPTA